MPTLQMVSGGGSVPTVNMNGQVVPAPPLYNNGQPATAAWAIDPVNGSASPLVGAYSAYPHVVYAPQRIGADNLLLALSTAVANSPFTQRALELASKGVPGVQRPTAPRTPGASAGTPGNKTTQQQQKQQQTTPTATVTPQEDLFNKYANPPDATDFAEWGRVPAVPELTILDSAQNGLVPREETELLNRPPTEQEIAVALGALGLGEGAGIAALSRALAQDAAIRKYGEYAGGKMSFGRFLTTPAGRAMLGSALGRVLTTGVVPLNLALAAKGLIDYGTQQGMNVLDWNSSDDMTIPEGVLE